MNGTAEIEHEIKLESSLSPSSINACEHFFSKVKYPLVLVSALPKKFQETVARFLLSLNVPVYLEGISGLREDVRLQPLRVSNPDSLLKESLYPIDGILRLGGVPTPRIWRDLETKEGKIRVLSVSHLPFSGLSWGELVHTDSYEGLPFCRYGLAVAEPLFKKEEMRRKRVQTLLAEFPLAEPSLIFALSQKISSGSLVYLGNSLPIREWDLFASSEPKGLDTYASRGVNGIDGQLSTFFGMCLPERDNWGLFGDLTTLYDLAAPWIVPQLKEIRLQVVVVNNGGGMIFSRRFPYESFLNRHQISFEPFAKMWGIAYERCEGCERLECERLEGGSLDGKSSEGKRGERNRDESCLIELIPDAEQTARFWDAY